MAVIDGLLGKTECCSECFGRKELFHGAMILGKQSHDCLEYRNGLPNLAQAYQNIHGACSKFAAPIPVSPSKMAKRRVG